MGSSFRSSKTLLVVAILIATGVGLYFSLDNTDSPHNFPEKHIDQFAGIEWGTSPERVLSRYPEEKIDSTKMYPKTNTVGKRVVVSDYSMDGDTVDIGFVFHPESGLVKGYYYAHFGRGDDCLRIYEKFSDAIDNEIKQFKTRSDKTNQLEVPFCYATLVGKALKHSQWKTPEGLIVTMILGGEKSKRRVRVFYETPAFYAWQNRLGGNTFSDFLPDIVKRDFFQLIHLLL